MNGFFPTGPATSLYAIILLCSVVLVLRYTDIKYRDIAIAMFASWLLARTTTMIDYFQIQVFGTIVISLFLTRVRNFTAYVVIGLFILKIALYMLYTVVHMHIESMWLVSEILAYFQIIAMMFGGFIGTYKPSGKFNSNTPRYLGGVLPVHVAEESRRESLGATGNDMEKHHPYD